MGFKMELVTTFPGESTAHAAAEEGRARGISLEGGCHRRSRLISERGRRRTAASRRGRASFVTTVF